VKPVVAVLALAVALVSVVLVFTPASNRFFRPAETVRA
jgi:hypothetical protein